MEPAGARARVSQWDSGRGQRLGGRGGDVEKGGQRPKAGRGGAEVAQGRETGDGGWRDDRRGWGEGRL